MHLKSGAVRGLSIGLTLPKGQGKVEYRDDGARLLREIHLHEISIVAVPAAPRAQITSVKSLADVRHVLKSMRDVGDGELGELHEIHRELKRLLVGSDPDEQRAEVLAHLRAFQADLQRIGG